MLIGQLAKLAGVSRQTVRFYERKHILEPKARTSSGYRVYSNADLKRLRLIIWTKELGFTLREITELLHYCEQSDVEALKQLVQEKQKDIQSQLLLLKGKVTALNRFLKEEDIQHYLLDLSL